MSSRRVASILLRASGLVMMMFGVVHLIATPHIPALLDGLPPKARDFAVGPTLLNHVLVGILLLPLGFTAWVAADERRMGEAWARMLLTAYALTLLTLPAAIVLLMHRAAYFHAPLFLAGVALTVVTAILVVIAAWVGVRARPA